MSSSPVRTRFAPSPTGYLHIGGARTALYNWLYARQHKGTFVLRIEDTDRERSREEYLKDIVDSMGWLGLGWDEGPIRQTERIELYRSYVGRLEQAGHVYRCTCSPAELEERRRAAMKEGRPPKYDGRCRRRTDSPAGPYALRFKAPEAGVTEVQDLIRGTIRFPNEEIEDLIVLRSNGMPTYNLTVVVDDAENRITHVIRGEDHLNNTPKQIHLYRALGLDPPQFAHLPLILGEDRSRLSKRHGAVSVTAYREEGFLPEALLNFLARIGWSHGDEEIFTVADLLEKFTLKGVGKTSGVFNEQKLEWLNAHYTRQLSKDELRRRLMPFLVERLRASGGGSDLTIHDSPRTEVATPSDGISSGHSREAEVPRGESEPLVRGSRFTPDWWDRAMDAFRERAGTLKVMAEQMTFLFVESVTFDEKARGKFLRPEALPYLEQAVRSIEEAQPFETAPLEEAFKAICERAEIKMGQLAQPVRVALTGSSASPGIFDVIWLLGRDRTLEGLRKAIAEIRGEVAAG
ncbi:MAG: glutamate--tRNA ligase [Nitrospirae bacterium]|nr:glutamate--tRNA ligase [Nitrospirota bacterium]